MTLANGFEVLAKAQSQKYAVGGFDIFNLESMQAIIAAAEELGSPIFLQACVRSLNHIGIKQAALMMRQAASQASVPVVVHFDHGPDPTQLVDVSRVLEAGFTSVMVDGSWLPIDENIELTRNAVRMARCSGAAVEGEIGKIGRITAGRADEVAQRITSSPGSKDWLTSPEEATRFVRESGVDYVAISIGSISGSSSRLDLALLQDLAKLIPIPIVLHGGTGVLEEDLSKAIKLGITKVNIAHGIRRVFIKTLRDALSEGTNTDNPYVLLNQAREDMKSYVSEKIRQLKGAS